MLLNHHGKSCGMRYLPIMLLASEVGIMLWDFVEEDHTRPLAPGGRVTHALMGMIYGALLASLLLEIWRWLAQPTAFAPHPHGPIAWLLSAMATLCLSTLDSNEQIL